jgi:flavodoxin
MFDIAVQNRVIVAFYSKTGHTRALGLEIARRLKGNGIDVCCKELEPEEEPTLIQTGHRTLTHGPLPIKDCALDLGDANLLLIGSPIWVGGASPYIRSFLENMADLKGIPVVLFATCSKRDGKAADELRQLVRDQGGRPFEYHVWRIQRDGAHGLNSTAEDVVTSALDMLPSR